MKRLKQSMAYANANWTLKSGFFIPAQKQASANSTRARTGNKTSKASENSTVHAEEYGLNIALENLPAKYFFFMSKHRRFHAVLP